jgi:hypothetical protein
MKVHLRVMPLAGRTYRVVTLRPSVGVRYSTNYYHDTWHVVSDTAGARVLGRLLWGLAYQKQPGTLVLIAEPHLVETPFDGARSQPVVLIPSGLTPVCEGALRQLKESLPRLGPPTQTIRWHTFGLDRELAVREAEEHKPFHARRWQTWSPDRDDSVRRAERMSKLGGLICYTAPPLVLRAQAAIVARMHTTSGKYQRTEYHDLGDHELGCAPEGEVQILHDYRDRVSAASVARREVLSRPDAPADPDALEDVVSARRDVLLRKRRRLTSRRVAQAAARRSAR